MNKQKELIILQKKIPKNSYFIYKSKYSNIKLKVYTYKYQYGRWFIGVKANNHPTWINYYDSLYCKSLSRKKKIKRILK